MCNQRRWKNCQGQKRRVDAAPKGMEFLKDAKQYRREARSALVRAPKKAVRKALKRNCTMLSPCRSGLCAACISRLRYEFLLFAVENKLALQKWFLVTIDLGEVRTPGDYRRFKQLKRHPIVVNLMARYRRANEKIEGELFIVGSVEVNYPTHDSRATDRRLHVHLLVAGLPEETVTKHARGVAAEGPALFPSDVRSVGLCWNDFAKVSTYCLKQPLLKKSFYKKASVQRWKYQTLKPPELAELASNLGAISCTDRLVLVGFRYEADTFRFSKRNRSIPGTCS